MSESTPDPLHQAVTEAAPAVPEQPAATAPPPGSTPAKRLDINFDVCLLEPAVWKERPGGTCAEWGNFRAEVLSEGQPMPGAGMWGFRIWSTSQPNMILRAVAGIREHGAAQAFASDLMRCCAWESLARHTREQLGMPVLDLAGVPAGGVSFTAPKLAMTPPGGFQQSGAAPGSQILRPVQQPPLKGVIPSGGSPPMRLVPNPDGTIGTSDSIAELKP